MLPRLVEAAPAGPHLIPRAGGRGGDAEQRLVLDAAAALLFDRDGRPAAVVGQTGQSTTVASRDASTLRARPRDATRATKAVGDAPFGTRRSGPSPLREKPQLLMGRSSLSGDAE